MRISDWSSDVCSSDLHDLAVEVRKVQTTVEEIFHEGGPPAARPLLVGSVAAVIANPFAGRYVDVLQPYMEELKPLGLDLSQRLIDVLGGDAQRIAGFGRSEEHTSELQSLMRISYAVFCLKKKKKKSKQY